MEILPRYVFELNLHESPMEQTGHWRRKDGAARIALLGWAALLDMFEMDNHPRTGIYNIKVTVKP